MGLAPGLQSIFTLNIRYVGDWGMELLKRGPRVIYSHLHRAARLTNHL